MTNNAISKYATENGINLYEAVSIASSIAIKNELDYIEILDSHHPKELFFQYLHILKMSGLKNPSILKKSKLCSNLNINSYVL